MPNHIMNFLKNNIEPSFFKNTMFNANQYPELLEGIPDEIVIIIQSIPFSEYEEAYQNTKKYLAEYEIFPFLENLGGQLVCIGYGKENEYLIYYFDSEFGIFSLNESYDDFCHKLQKANFDWLP